MELKNSRIYTYLAKSRVCRGYTKKSRGKLLAYIMAWLSVGMLEQTECPKNSIGTSIIQNVHNYRFGQWRTSVIELMTSSSLRRGRRCRC